MKIRKVLSVTAVVGIVGVIGPATFAGPASAKTKTHKAPATCTAPKINRVSAVRAEATATPAETITIRGRCFGAATFTNGLSPDFEVIDNVIPASQVGNTYWNACHTVTSGITCTVSWSADKIVLRGFNVAGTTPYFGQAGTDYTLHTGDSLTFEVWAYGSTATSSPITVKAARTHKKGHKK